MDGASSVSRPELMARSPSGPLCMEGAGSDDPNEAKFKLHLYGIIVVSQTL